MIRSLSRRASSGLVGPAFIYIFAAAVNAAIPFLLLPLIARWLGPADFGVIGGFVAIINVLILLVGLNAYGFVSVGYYRDGPQNLPHLTGAAMTIILAASAIVTAAGWIGGDWITRLTQIDRSWLWTLSAAAAGQAILAVGLTVAQTTRKPFVYGSFQIGYGLTLAVLAVILVGAVQMGWRGRALAQALAAIGLAAAVLVWLRAKGQLTFSVSRPAIAQALLFGVPLLPHSLAAVAMASMDRLALSSSFSPSVVGYYFLAVQIAGLFTALAGAVNQAWVPWLYERLKSNDPAAWEQIERILKAGGVLLIVGAAGMALLAGPIVLLVGGTSFAPAVTPLRILGFYAAAQAWYTLVSAFFFYAGRIRLLSALTVSVAIIQAALIALAVRWGASGVAAALLASSIAGAAFISLAARRLATSHRAAGQPGLADVKQGGADASSSIPAASRLVH